MNTTPNIIMNILNVRRTLSLALLATQPLFIGCAGGGMETQSPASAEDAPIFDTTTFSDYPNTIRVWRDFSASMDDGTLERMADDLVAAIAQHADRFAGIEIIRFSEANHSIWQAVPKKFVWGSPPVIKEFYLDSENVPQDAKMFKDAREQYEREQKRLYNENRTRILKEYKERVDDQLSKFKVYLLERPSTQAPCTRFGSLAARMQQEDLPYNLTISDGWADCPEEANGNVSAVGIHGKHIIIQLVRHTDTQANDIEIPKREAFLRSVFPSAAIFQPSATGKALDSLFR